MAETQTLRPYQQQARERIHAEWENGRLRTLLVLPTGTGKTIVFASTVRHAEHAAEAFRAEGVNAAVVSGKTPSFERAALLRRFDEGDVQVLVNVAVLTEGYDSQPVSCVVLLRPCSFKSTMLQMIGRGLRTVDPARYPGVVKTDCVVMDFGRSLATHRDLESKVRMEDKQKPCPECGAEIPCGVMECPICGHVFKGPASLSTARKY